MGPAALHSSNQCCIIHIYLSYLGLCLQARSLVCAPMETCYSNLMHDNGKGLRSLILSLIGLNVNPSVCPPCVYSCVVLLPVPFLSTEMNWNPILVPDRHVSGPDEGFLERDAAVHPAGAAVCWQESVGGGAAVRSVPEGRRSHLCDGPLPGSVAAGDQAGEGHLQRWVELRMTQNCSESVWKETHPQWFCLCLSSSGSVDLAYSQVLYLDLTKGLDGLQLNSFLHLLYLVTPYDILSQCKPEWMTYLRQVEAVNP